LVVKLRVISYGILVIGAFTGTAPGELTVSVNPEAKSLFVYEPFTVLLETGAEAESPQVQSGGGFTVTGIIKTENGYRIELIPEEAGMLTLPPIEIRAGEETAQTPPLRLAIDAPRRAAEMSLRTELSATNLFVDQPVKMTITWNSPVPFPRCQDLLLDIPLLRNSQWEVYPLEPGVPENERIGLPVNNQRAIARLAPGELSFSFMLVPRRAGISAAAEIRLNCALVEDKRSSSQYPSYFDNHFFNRPDPSDRFERIWLTSATPELTVQAQPEACRSPRYSGIAGGGTATAAIRPTEAVVGQPMLLTLDLQDLPFGPGIPELPKAVLEGIGSEFQITPHPLHETATANTRSFTYVLRPLRSGIEKIPAMVMQIFDPDKKTYRTVRTEPLSIRVDPDGEKIVYEPHTSEDRKPQTPLSGIRGNRKESRLTMKTYTLFELVAAGAWVLWLLPPLLWLALRPWLRRHDRCRIDPVYAHALRAARCFHRTVKLGEEAAWKTYLADRFGLNADAVTYETVAPELEKQSVPDELLKAVQDRFKRRDTEHYAPPSTPPQTAPPASELVRKIEKSTRLLLLLICLLPIFDSDAAAPDQLFGQAMQIRAEKPDEATPLFTEAALGFEAERHFFNAGNSWFFAGENGRALANYRAAESRRPFDKQLRESIAFIRTQRADIFQISEKPTAKISRVWKQFGRWSPVIRGGLLTLIYLTGWAAFLIARFTGKRIPRRAWIVFGIVAAVPATSLVRSVFQPLEGVIIQTTEAYFGPGYAYDKAMEAPLHEATEFQWMETRDGWVHARLPDTSEAWLRDTACQSIR
jgi:hypothetical protein